MIRLDCGRSSNLMVGFFIFWLRGADDKPCFSLCIVSIGKTLHHQPITHGDKWVAEKCNSVA